MAKAVKENTVKEIKKSFAESAIIIFADFQGLTVEKMHSLRKDLRKSGAKFKVVKNTLLNRASSDMKVEQLEGVLKGPTAVIHGTKEPCAASKILVKFAKENEQLKIKGGIYNAGYVDEKKIKEIASIPSREVLLAKLVGGLKSPIFGLVNVLSGPKRKLVYALDAIKNKKGVS